MRKHFLPVILIAILLAMCGCAGEQEVQIQGTAGAGEESSEEMLRFSVTALEEPGYTVISQEERKTDAYIAYLDLAEVAVHIDGADIPLAEAIREEKLTVPEILAFARRDARNGFCRETYVSEHGLTHFSYTYPECEVQIAYDVYETPDGNQTLIEEIYILAITDQKRTISHTYVDEESPWGYFLDREDWGLAFEVSSVSPTQITLDYSQQGGQQIGELFVEEYILYPMEDDGAPAKAPGYLGKSKESSGGLPIPLPSDTLGQITIDWSDTAGTLAPGEYYLKLSLSDSYEESDVHPLMENYYDRQSYHVAFSIE